MASSSFLQQFPDVRAAELRELHLSLDDGEVRRGLEQAWNARALTRVKRQQADSEFDAVARKTRELARRGGA